jgi:hypothetical protein
MNDRGRQRTIREPEEREDEMGGGGRAQFRVMFRAGFPSCAVQPRNDTVVGRHVG